MKLYRKFAVLIVLLCFTTAFAQAQSQDQTCSVIVQQALSTVQNACSPTGRNQACYGYVALDATPRQGVEGFTFSQQGDLANVADLDTIRLSGLNTTANTWGIALMKLQANLPDALPGQNVTFLLFGDVQIQNAVPASADLATLNVTANSNVNIRSSPSTSGQVLGSMAKGDTATANGRNQDGSWLRIQIPDSNSLGWVFATLVTPASDVSALSAVDASQTEEPLKPMQAFYFQTGITQTTCAAAPADGILIQTPEGAGKIDLRANDVDVTLGSTAFFQAQPSANMTVSVVEGEGTITAGGTTVSVPAGSQVDIPVDANLKASGPPGQPHPYDEALVQNLPVQVLPRQITIAPPTSAAQIADANATASPPGGGGNPFAGGLPGMGGSIPDLSGDSAALLCAAIGQSVAQAGMTLQQYLAAVQQMMAYLPSAADKASLQQLVAILQTCP